MVFSTPKQKTVLTFGLIFSLLIFKYFYHTKKISLSHDDVSNQANLRKLLNQQAKEFRQKGYITIPSGSILDNDQIKKLVPLLSLNELQNNTHFKIIKPTWLPKKVSLKAVFLADQK